MGARVFYFSVYAFFYLSMIKYPNSLSQSMQDRDYVWVFFYLILHATAIFYFVTSGHDPGYVESDLERKSRSLQRVDGVEVADQDSSSVAYSLDETHLELGNIQ